MIEKIFNKNKQIAIVVRDGFKSKGINFFTKNSMSLQLGYFFHKKGHKIKNHYHLNEIKIIKKITEVLYVKKGELKIVFYTKKKVKILHKILKKGDLIYIFDDAHEIFILKNSEIIEIKQGPYDHRKDKKLI
jgi:hypothetical protein